MRGKEYMAEVSPMDITFLSEFFKKNSGFRVRDTHITTVAHHLQPVIQRYNFSNLSDLIQSLQRSPSPDLIQQCLEAVAVHETMFFRDNKPFHHFIDFAIPEIVAAKKARGEKTIRIWSAACSSGQEPYSIAMTLEDNKNKLHGLNYEILATDLSGPILERAKLAVYSEFEVLRGISSHLQENYFDSYHGNKWRVKKHLRKHISFRKMNLFNIPKDVGKFDIIFCRNVLIYFDRDEKNRVIDSLHSHHNNPGYLYVGNADILEKRGLYETAAQSHGIYTKKD